MARLCHVETTFNTKLADRFLVAVRAGARNEAAAARADVPLTTVESWLKDRPALARDVEKARPDLELLAVDAGIYDLCEASGRAEERQSDAADLADEATAAKSDFDIAVIDPATTPATSYVARGRFSPVP